MADEQIGTVASRMLPLSQITLIYQDAAGAEYEQSLSELESVGTLIDPESGDDLELVGWRFAEEREHAAMAAIERIAKIVESDDSAAWDAHQELVRLITRTTPTEALRERDAEKWEEGHSAGVHDVANARLFNMPPTRNPYRTEHSDV